MQQNSPAFSKTVALFDDGLVLGARTQLAHFAEGTDRLNLDPARLTGLLATAFGRPPSDAHMSAIASAAAHWQRGDRAVANLRLVFAKLPVLDAPADVCRLKAAELLFDAGLTAADVAAHLGSDQFGLGKYDPDQPRVPAGQGRDSGRWTNGLWSRFRAWLDEDVPVYDHDTGDVVGTRSRAWAIATNPLTILAVGAVAILASEVLLPLVAAGAVAEAVASAAAVVEDAEVLAPVVDLEVSSPGIAANAARGAESEARVLQDMGLSRNTRAVGTAEGRSIPDALTDEVSVEIKDSGYVSCTKQVRIQTEAAEASGRQSILVTGENTKISGNAEIAFDQILRRQDLGPR